MNHFVSPITALILTLVFCPSDWAAAEDEPRSQGVEDVLMHGGCGGVYFLAERGELQIALVKRDRNRHNRHTQLRAILVGPDRRVVQERKIPDDGQPRGSGLGPPQWVNFSTQVPRKGVYALNITVSQDRYGREMVWGFRTNCPRYLIETARGHKDERHQEPIVLASPKMPTDVCFRPRIGAFNLEVSGLSEDVESLRLSRHGDGVVKTIPVRAGEGAASIPAQRGRDQIPWRLQLPSARATINVGGLTRWRDDDLSEDMCLWSPNSSSWFPFLEHRWLLTPYRRIAYGEPGTEGRVAFRVHNNSSDVKRVNLRLEFSNGQWPVQLEKDAVTVSSGKAVQVPLKYIVPEEEGRTRTCHLRVTPVDAPEFTTYSTLIVKSGKAPAAKPLDLPIMFKPYQHENEMFGYLPDYPLDNQMYFDLENRPFVSLGSDMATLKRHEWIKTDLGSAVRSPARAFKDGAFRMMNTKIAFDRDNDVYALASTAGKPAYLHSTDRGITFTAYEIPGPRGRFDIEQFSGHNVPESPPPFVRFVRTGGRDPRLRWRRENKLELFVPRKVDGEIEMGQPILISKMAIGLSAHSGIPSSVVSRDTNVHVAWGEATDPEASRDEIPGVPTYVVTYNRETKALGKSALIGYGPPPNDVHNSPSITMDGEGILHLLIGTHGRPFQYAKSLRPNDAQGGWTDPVLAGDGLRQTYIGFVCGRDGTLHTVFRLWRSGEPFPHGHHATLAYQRKRPGHPWEPPKILCHAPFSEYSIFYHRLTIDQRGRLFLSKDYWSTYWFYRNDHFGDRRSLLMSSDRGDTWKLASGKDLQEGMTRKERDLQPYRGN
ncbi:MAG: BNR-4 repeat-containing protein [Planctomycetota bacterium]